MCFNIIFFVVIAILVAIMLYYFANIFVYEPLGLLEFVNFKIHHNDLICPAVIMLCAFIVTIILTIIYYIYMVRVRKMSRR